MNYRFVHSWLLLIVKVLLRDTWVTSDYGSLVPWLRENFAKRVGVGQCVWRKKFIQSHSFVWKRFLNSRKFIRSNISVNMKMKTGRMFAYLHRSPFRWFLSSEIRRCLALSLPCTDRRKEVNVSQFDLKKIKFAHFGRFFVAQKVG